jgi:hypothetical protein
MCKLFIFLLKSTKMKSGIKILTLALCLGGMVSLFSCGDDDPGPGSSDFCNFEACANSDTAKKVCMDEYDDCVAAGKLSNDECSAFAQETCTY